MIESHTSASAGRVVHLCRCGCGGGNAMSDEKTVLKGPDLTQGIELSRIADGTMLLGHARGEPVLLARRGDELFAIGAICTHYGAPLETGLLVGDTVRCPWHHACFSLRTGEALRAPALARGAVGPSRERRPTRGARLHADLPAGGQAIGSRRHSPRSRGSSRGGGFRKSNRGSLADGQSMLELMKPDRALARAWWVRPLAMNSRRCP